MRRRLGAGVAILCSALLLAMLAWIFGRERVVDIAAATGQSVAGRQDATASVLGSTGAAHHRRVNVGDPAARDATSQHADTMEFRVRVVSDASHQPIEDAHVEILPTELRGANADDVRLDAQTDASGNAIVQKVQPCCLWVLRVTAAGHVAVQQVLEIAPGMDVWEVALAPGVTVEIVVVEVRNGSPVEGAIVNVGGDQPLTTDVNGVATATLAPRKPVIVGVGARGFVGTFDIVRPGEVGEPPRTLRISLERGATVRGVVFDPDGQPVAGASVDIGRVADEMECASAETDLRGRFEISGLILDDKYFVSARHDELGWSHDEVVEPTTSNLQVFVDLRLLRPGSVHLVIADSKGDEIDDATLDFASSGVSTSYAASGLHVEITQHRAGECSVHVDYPDHVPIDARVKIRAGEHRTEKIQLSSGVSVSGVVVDDSGSPVEGARVGRRAETDAEGRFLLTTLPEGPVDVPVSPPWDWEETLVRGVTAPNDDLRVVVRRRGRLALRAVCGDGESPGTDARIEFTGTKDGLPWTIDRILPRNGAFEIAWPAEVRGPITIGVSGWSHVERDFVVPLGARLDLGEIALRRGCSLAGTLLDVEGKPANGARIITHPRGRSVTTGPDGRFRLPDLSPGPVRLVVSSMQPLGCSFALTLPRTEDAILQLPRPGALLVTSRRPGSVFSVLDFMNGDVGDVPRFTDEDGRALLDLASGRYTVTAADGLRAEIEIREGDITLVRLP